MAARAKNRSPRHLVLDSQVMRNLQIAPALAPKTHALTCQETLDTLSPTSSMQPVPYLKPDKQKTNLKIRSLADNLMHWVTFLPLAARLSASPQKSPKCSRVGTLRGFRLQRDGRKKGEGREERCCGISGDNQALYLLLPHVSFPMLHRARSCSQDPWEEGRDRPAASGAYPAFSRNGGERSCCGSSHGDRLLQQAAEDSPSHPKMKSFQQDVWGQQTGPGWYGPVPPTSPRWAPALAAG